MIDLPSPQTPDERRVLLVDDNEDALDLLSTFLESAGFEALQARDAAEALTLLRERCPRVALIDISMPVVNGYELAARIRALPGEQPGLIALTGFGGAEDRARSEAAGFDDHLVKPVDFAKLLAAIPRAIERAAQAR